MISTAPLTDAQWAQLDDFLLSDAAPDNSMNSAMLDGYLTAIVSAPNLHMPSDWLRWVSDTKNGTDEPGFTSQEQATLITRLLVQHYQHLNHTLMETPELYKPRLYEHQVEGRSVTAIDEWCAGYYAGITLDVPGWSPLLMAQPLWFATILLHGTDDAPLMAAHGDLDAHQARANGLAATVRTIHAFWLQERVAQHANGTLQVARPVRSTPKVGRNEPCPCGSGKKFKHCHGNA